MAVVLAVGVVMSAGGAAITDLGPWYKALTLPHWQPPGPVFGIIWTTIYVLASIAAVLGWRTVNTKDVAIKFLGVFGVNCVLNLMWSFLFFRMHRPDWALYQVGFFWLSILALILYVGSRTKVGGALLVPYIVWVTIAVFLNYEVVVLNGPFS
jgi:translocator protein